MKKFYSIFIMAIVAAITGFQAHAETLKMNVTGATFSTSNGMAATTTAITP